MTKSMMRSVEKAVEQAAEARELNFAPGSDRNYVISWELSWLSPEELQEIRGHVRLIKMLMDGAKQKKLRASPDSGRTGPEVSDEPGATPPRTIGKDDRLYLTLAMATPVVRKRSERDRRRRLKK